MDKTRAKIKSTSMTTFVAILAIALLFRRRSISSTG